MLDTISNEPSGRLAALKRDEAQNRILERLNNFKLIAGDNISLTQTQEGLVISAKAVPLTPKLKRWLLEADEEPSCKKVLPGANIFLEEDDYSVRINAKIPPQGGSRTPVQVLNFPFKAVRSGDSAVTVQGYNESAGRYFRNYVSLGISRLEVAEAELTGISSDSWIYLEIAWAGSAYSATLKSGSSLPAQSSDKYYVPIAFVRTSDGKVGSVHQAQFGQIDHPGRLF